VIWGSNYSNLVLTHVSEIIDEKGLYCGYHSKVGLSGTEITNIYFATKLTSTNPRRPPYWKSFFLDHNCQSSRFSNVCEILRGEAE